MSIHTTGNVEDKREKIRKLREFHQKTLDSIGVPGASFIPKMAYKPIGKNELCIGFFASEINKGEDVYVEFCSRDNDPEDVDRTLYKFKNNPHFEDEYDKTEPSSSTGHVRYLVPVEELIVIKKYTKETLSEAINSQQEIKFDLEDPETDQPFNQMTIRDFAAIMLKTPVSRKDWLNMIIEDLNKK